MVSVRRILNNNLLRQLTILELIIDSDEQSPQQLSKTLHVDEKTIRKDIIAINNMIAPLNVHIAKTGKYQLMWLDNYQKSYIYSCFLSASTEFHILEKILVEEELAYNELADAVFVSVSTLRRSIVRMNTILVDYDIEIATNPVRLRGDERSILSFFYNYLKEKYVLSQRFLSPLESRVIEDILKKLLPQFSLRWSFTISETLKWLVKINAIRMANGNVISVNPTVRSREIHVLTQRIIPFHDRLEKVFGVDVHTQLIESVVQNGYALSLQELAELEQKDQQIAEKVKAIRHILTAIERDMLVTNKYKDRVVLALYNQLICHYGTPYLLNDPRDEFLVTLKQERPSFVNLLVKHYRGQAPLLAEQQLSKFTFYVVTEWEELFSKLNKVADNMRIGLFFATTNSHIEFLKDELERKLSPQLVLINLNDYALSNLDEAAVDLIVTNMSQLTTNQASLCISEYPSEGDLINIARAHEKWLDDKL